MRRLTNKATRIAEYTAPMVDQPLRVDHHLSGTQETNGLPEKHATEAGEHQRTWRRRGHGRQPLKIMPPKFQLPKEKGKKKAEKLSCANMFNINCTSR